MCADDLPPKRVPWVPHSSQLAQLPSVCHFRVCSLPLSCQCLVVCEEKQDQHSVEVVPSTRLGSVAVSNGHAQSRVFEYLKLECGFLQLSVIS